MGQVSELERGQNTSLTEHFDHCCLGCVVNLANHHCTSLEAKHPKRLRTVAQEFGPKRLQNPTELRTELTLYRSSVEKSNFHFPVIICPWQSCGLAS